MLLGFCHAYWTDQGPDHAVEGWTSGVARIRMRSVQEGSGEWRTEHGIRDLNDVDDAQIGIRVDPPP